METLLIYRVIVFGSTSALNLKRAQAVEKSADSPKVGYKISSRSRSLRCCRPAENIDSHSDAYSELILLVDKIGLSKESRPQNYNSQNVSLIPTVRHQTILHDKKLSTTGAPLYYSKYNGYGYIGSLLPYINYY